MQVRWLPLLFVTLALTAAEPKPILVVIEQDPWSEVIGSDSPTLALYDDGTLIYLRAKPTVEESFCSLKVPDPVKQQRDFFPIDLTKLKDQYELTDATDQITTVIWTPQRRIGIYGDWRRSPDFGGVDDPNFKRMEEHEKKKWHSFREELQKDLTRVDEFRSKISSSWLPKNIEIMFWPYEYAPDESIVWPKQWPGLTAPASKKRGNDSYSIYIPSTDLSKLISFLKTRKEKGAILIDGKKMSAAYRFPFPEEKEWMKPKP